MSKLWENYNSEEAYDGYFTKDNKLRKHATIISSILERHGKKKLQEIEKNCQSTISARGINFRVYAANNRAEEKKWPLELYLVYSQGNYIKPADSKPYLVIGEVKYGKPILDRVIKPSVSIGDASRCALISMDSTLKSDLTVGPPIDFAVYKKDEYKIASQKCLNITDTEYSKVCDQWSDGIFKIFDSFPRFDWENNK